VLRAIGGAGALIFAGFLLLRGEIGVAVTVGLFGLGLLGYVTLWPATLGARTKKSAGQASRVPHRLSRNGARPRQRRYAWPHSQGTALPAPRSDSSTA